MIVSLLCGKTYDYVLKLNSKSGFMTTWVEVKMAIVHIYKLTNVKSSYVKLFFKCKQKIVWNDASLYYKLPLFVSNKLCEQAKFYFSL